MKTPTPVADIAHQLAVIGLQIRPEHVPALLGWAGVIGAATLTGWFAILKVRTDKRSLSMGELWAMVVQQGKDIDHLKREMGALRSENRQLQDTVRDRDETLKDYAAHVLNRDAADASDGALPTPEKTWRILEHLAEHTKHRAAQAEREG